MKNCGELIRSDFPIQQLQKQQAEFIVSSAFNYAAFKDSLNGDHSTRDD